MKHEYGGKTVKHIYQYQRNTWFYKTKKCSVSQSTTTALFLFQLKDIAKLFVEYSRRDLSHVISLQKPFILTFYEVYWATGQISISDNKWDYKTSNKAFYFHTSNRSRLNLTVDILYIPTRFPDCEGSFIKICSSVRHCIPSGKKYIFCNYYPAFNFFAEHEILMIKPTLHRVSDHSKVILKATFSATGINFISTTNIMKHISKDITRDSYLILSYTIGTMYHLTVFFISVPKFNRIKISMPKLFKSIVHDGPDLSAYILKSSTNIIVTSGFQVTIETLSYPNTLKGIRKNVMYHTIPSKPMHKILLNSTQDSLLILNIPKDVCTLSFCMLHIETTDHDYINLTVVRLSKLRNNPQCTHGGLVIGEQLQGNITELITMCEIIGTCTQKIRRFYSTGQIFSLFIYWYNTLEKLNISLWISMTSCSGIQIDPCLISGWCMVYFEDLNRERLFMKEKCQLYLKKIMTFANISISLKQNPFVTAFDVPTLQFDFDKSKCIVIQLLSSKTIHLTHYEYESLNKKSMNRCPLFISTISNKNIILEVKWSVPENPHSLDKFILKQSWCPKCNEALEKGTNNSLPQELEYLNYNSKQNVTCIRQRPKITFEVLVHFFFSSDHWMEVFILKSNVSNRFIQNISLPTNMTDIKFPATKVTQFSILHLTSPDIMTIEEDITARISLVHLSSVHPFEILYGWSPTIKFSPKACELQLNFS